MPVVMSWNVESLGASKLATLNGAGRPEIISTLATVIDRSQAQVFGLMEIKGGQGMNIAQQLVAELTNRAPGGRNWRVFGSGRQAGGTQEEYLYIYQHIAGEIEADLNAEPATASLMGVFDPKMVDDILPTAVERAALIDALVTGHYIGNGRYRVRSTMRTTNDLRVVGEKWNELLDLTTRLIFVGPQPAYITALPDAMHQRLKARLSAVDVIRFITFGDRSPFMLNLNIVDPHGAMRSVLITMVHEPGPQDPTRMAAINIAAMSIGTQRCIAAGAFGLLMGDFNIAAGQMHTGGIAYGRVPALAPGTGVVFKELIPRQVVQVFTPFANAWGAYTDMLAANRTSVVHRVLPPAAVGGDELSSAYDKFLAFQGASTITAQNAAVQNLIQASVANPAWAGGAEIYRAAKAAGLAESLDDKKGDFDREVLRIKKKITPLINNINNEIANHPIIQPGSPEERRINFWQAKVNLLQTSQNAVNAQRNDLTLIINDLSDATVTVPTNLAMSLSTYAYAVSDHLPITVELA